MRTSAIQHTSLTKIIMSCELQYPLTICDLISKFTRVKWKRQIQPSLGVDSDVDMDVDTDADTDADLDTNGNGHLHWLLDSPKIPIILAIIIVVMNNDNGQAHCN